MGRAWKKRVTLGKKCQTWKNGSHFEKWVTLEEKSATPGKMGHSLKKWVTLKNGLHFEKWVTL